MIIFNSGNNKIYLNLFDKIVYGQSDILFTIKNSLTKVSKDLYPTIVSTSNKYYEFSIDLVDANQENLTGGTINLQTGYYDIYVKNYSGNNETIILEERGRVIGQGRTINNIQTVNTNNLQFPEDSFCDKVSNCDVVKGKLNISDFNNYSANTNNTLTGITNSLNNKVSKSGDNISYLDFDLTGGTNSVGRLIWNDADGTLDLGLKGGNVILQIGQEQVVRVVNKTNTNLLESEYKVVRLDGAQGNRPKISLAQANSITGSSETIGLVTENINNNEEGFITTFGLVRNINTTGSLQGETWLDGDILYLSTSNLGGLTKVAPTYPNKVVVVGYVIRAHSNQGKIFVKVDVKTNKDDIGLGNVDNTSDVNKPISTATQIALNNKLDVSTFSGYSSTTQTQINNKLDISDFNTYSSTTQTQINNKLDISDFNTYSSTTQTQINNKLDISDFNNYSANTNNTLTGLTSSATTNSNNITNLQNNKFDKSGGTITGIVNLQTLSASTAPLAVSGGTIYAVNRSGLWVNRPTSPFVGQIYFATDIGSLGTLFTWNGTIWKADNPITYLDNTTYNTTNTTETIVKSQIIPAGILQTNSIIDVEFLYQISWTTGTIVLRGFFDTTSSGTGNIFSTTSITTNQLQASSSKQIVNRNSLTNQLVRFTTTGTFGQQGTTTGGLPTFSANTANDTFINIAINRANTGNTVNLVMTKILIYQ